MSRKWMPELDAILLHGVFEECQISFGKALCEKLAERVRAAGVEGFTECTPKSIENRLYSWKKKNTTATTATGDTPVSTPKKAAPKPKESAIPKAKTPRAKKGAVKKRAGDEEIDEEPTPSAGRKRSAESEEAGEEKKAKLEHAGDEAAGEAELEEDV
ncbi:hypothetical protein N0V86_005369 [Didymella sp. IMI 355093]|nr:hypothetical protein N0V86_005369 [Didymella sp. IMI 355093]